MRLSLFQRVSFWRAVIMILIAARPAVRSAVAEPKPAQSKAERDETLRLQGIEDQIASLYERLQDLDDDRKDLDRCTCDCWAADLTGYRHGAGSG